MAVDIAEFLNARLDEDADLAQQASPGPWRANAEHDEVWAADDIAVCDGFALSNRQLRATVDHIALHDPERVLVDIAVKRELLRLHGPMAVTTESPWHNDGHLTSAPMTLCRSCEPETMSRRAKSFPCRTLLALVQSYVGHPDFDPAWRLQPVS